MGKIFDIVSNKPFKPFYNAFVPRSIRKRWRYQYIDKVKQEEVAKYWDIVIDKYANNEIEKYDLSPLKNELVGKKIIWQYWGQGFKDLPETVQICFASIDRYKGDYQVIRITDDNIGDYLNFPDFVNEKRRTGVFRPVFFSDLLRVALLSVYGGVWLDATILLTDELPTEYSQYDFFMYSRDPHSPNKDWGEDDSHFYFNWRDEFKVKHLSSVMFAQAGSLLATVLTDLLLYYWKNESDIKYYFFFQVLMNQLKNSNLLDFDFPIVDDTLPHLLQGSLPKLFDKVYFQSITSSVSIHKLSINNKFKNIKAGKLTYYGYLKQNYTDSQ